MILLPKKKAYNYQAEAKKWQDALDKYNAEAKKLKAEGQTVPPKNDYLKYNKPHKITPLNSRVTPSYLYNAKLRPLPVFRQKPYCGTKAKPIPGGKLSIATKTSLSLL